MSRFYLKGTMLLLLLLMCSFRYFFLLFNILCKIGNLNQVNRSYIYHLFGVTKKKRKESHEQITFSFSRLYSYVTRTYTHIDRIQTPLVIIMKYNCK